jgi:hypothetical protein
VLRHATFRRGGPVAALVTLSVLGVAAPGKASVVTRRISDSIAFSGADCNSDDTENINLNDPYAFYLDSLSPRLGTPLAPDNGALTDANAPPVATITDYGTDFSGNGVITLTATPTGNGCENGWSATADVSGAYEADLPCASGHGIHNLYADATTCRTARTVAYRYPFRTSRCGFPGFYTHKSCVYRAAARRWYCTHKVTPQSQDSVYFYADFVCHSGRRRVLFYITGRYE